MEDEKTLRPLVESLVNLSEEELLILRDETLDSLSSLGDFYNINTSENVIPNSTKSHKDNPINFSSSRTGSKDSSNKLIKPKNNEKAALKSSEDESDS